MSHSPLPAANLYALLGVKSNASEPTIKKAFHQKSLTHHPDKAGNTHEVHERYVKIVEAYEVLSDARKRRKYDAKSLHPSYPSPFPSPSSPPPSPFSPSARAQRSSHRRSRNTTSDSSSSSSQSQSFRARYREQAPREPSSGGTNPSKAAKQKVSFEDYGGYAIFRVEFDWWRKEQQQSKSQPQPQPNAEEEKKKGGRGGEEASFPPDLVRAHLELAVGPVRADLAYLKAALTLATARLCGVAWTLSAGSALENAIHRAERRRERMDRERADVALSIARIRGGGGGPSSSSSSSSSYVGLARGVDRLLAAAEVVYRVARETERLTHAIVKAESTARDGLIGELRGVIEDWLDGEGK